MSKANPNFANFLIRNHRTNRFVARIGYSFLVAGLVGLVWQVAVLPAGSQALQNTERNRLFVEKLVVAFDEAGRRGGANQSIYESAAQQVRSDTSSVVELRDFYCGKSVAGRVEDRVWQDVLLDLIFDRGGPAVALWNRNETLYTAYTAGVLQAVQLDASLCVAPTSVTTPLVPAAPVAQPTPKRSKTKCYNKKTTAIETVSGRKCPKGWRKV